MPMLWSLVLASLTSVSLFTPTHNLPYRSITFIGFRVKHEQVLL
nr:hypothetical protein Q903MT_gene1342 [Picea sitchensis]